MKKGILTSLGLAAVLTLGLVSVNEYRDVKEVDAEEKVFTKVTSIGSGLSGKYLIVCEDKSVAFNGSLDTLDATNNGVSVSVVSNQIAWTESLESSTFTFASVTGGYSIQSSSGYFIGRSATSNGLLATHTTYNSNNDLNTVTFSSNNVVIAGSGGPTLQYNAAVDQNRFRYYATAGSQKAIQLYKLETSGDDSETEQPNPEDNEVKALFEEYYNEGVYTKKSELKVNKLAANEVAKYFHASADVKYRTTEYVADGLTMTTSEDGKIYSTNRSIYANGDNCVVHSGEVGGNYTYSTNEIKTVEDWFVTLYDFKESKLTGWTEENGVYTYNLTSTGKDLEEAPMTRMAREFVAPMWLAPSTDNWAYAQFVKLTIQEVSDKLVMNLYVNNPDITDNAEGLFSQVEISYTPVEPDTPTVITTIEGALAASEGVAVELTGTVTEIYQEYSSEYSNISVYISDEAGKSILVFRLPVTSADAVKLHSKIKVSGTVTDYNGTMQVAAGATFESLGTEACSEFSEVTCTEDSVCKVCGEVITAALGHTEANAEGKCDRCGSTLAFDKPIVELATFDFGSNGSASHVDGTSLETSKSYTVGSYTLSLTSMSNVYGPAYDAKGNSCIKFGTSSKTGSMTFTVPNNVTEVVIYVAKYKANASKVTVNGTEYTLAKNSNDGAYDIIKVDTTNNKTVSFTTVSGGVRCMVNTIVFNGIKE